MKAGYKYTEIGQLKVYNRVVRNSFLLPFEQQVTLLFVLDRTVGWRKVWESISLAQFERGIFRRKRGLRTLIAPGTGLPPERIALALEALKKNRAIETEYLQSKVWYRVSEDWHHPELRPAGSLRVWGLTENDYIYDGE